MIPVFLSVTGLPLATYEGGTASGPPVLFVHGNSLAADTFHRQFAAPALQGFRLLAFDWPGHGQSADAPAHYAPADMARLLVAAVQALNCEQALAVGHSYGGNLLFDALPMLPRLRGLLAVGAPPISTGADAGQAFRFDETGGLFYAPALTADQALDLARYVLQPIPDPADVTRLLADLTRADGRFRAATAAAIAAGALADERGHVQVTPVPLAFAAGEFDPLLNPGYFDTLPAPTLWGQHLHRVPAASHLPMLENPAAFNALLQHLDADGE